MRGIEEIITRFREAGLKITPQRLSIFNLLQDNKNHPSAEAIYRQVLKTHPSISFTTVYKTLQTLRDMGEIQELNIDPERSHFDPDISEHAHTYCRVCRQIGDLDISPGMPPDLSLRAGPDGFEIHNLQVHAVGLCASCR